MILKKHKNRNTYILTEEGIWVRDFVNTNIDPIDLNKLSSKYDYKVFIENETKNRALRLPSINTEKIHNSKFLIVSDGYSFAERQADLLLLPSDVTILGTNGVLGEWNTKLHKKKINFYVVNNPFQDCMKYYPRTSQYFTHCIASTRTNNEFVQMYSKRGAMYSYNPTPNEYYSNGKTIISNYIDDYRSPICAAILLAYKFGAKKICLFCCDSSFSDKRNGSIELDNGLFCYEAARTHRGIVDGIAYWLSTNRDYQIKISDYSSGLKYKNIEYIESTEIADFFEGG